MRSIEIILTKIRQFAIHQTLIDILVHLMYALALTLVSLSLALFMLKSPLYALIGIIPLLFFRPRSLITRARQLERCLDLDGELVNSVQLARIPENSREGYSCDLINAYIDRAACAVKDLQIRSCISGRELNRAVLSCLIALALACIPPAFFPARFWFATHRDVTYQVYPGTMEFTKGSEIAVQLRLFTVYEPRHVELLLFDNSGRQREILTVQQGSAAKNLRLDSSLRYGFRFFGRTTEMYDLVACTPLHIEELSFHLRYPDYTGLSDEVLNGRQLIVPEDTRVSIKGKASQYLRGATLIAHDTLELTVNGKVFSGAFTIRESSAGLLRLQGHTELNENITIYAIPDMAPLVDIFYPGFNIQMPRDMNVDIGIRCNDDYGLQQGTFIYAFEDTIETPLRIRKGVTADTVFFAWDLSTLNLLPGDKVTYHVEIRDNFGNRSISKTYAIYFPTMEEMYDDISAKETMIEQNLSDLRTEHSDEMAEMKQLQEELMRERTFSWAEREKLREVISKETQIVEKIEDWQQEIERTLEKLEDGIMLDRESLERLREISRILQEIAPEELRQTLEKLREALEKKPQDLQRALESVRQNQEELARALERTLEVLRRFQQEEKLRELAEQARKLAEKAGEIDSLAETTPDLDLATDQNELDTNTEQLAEDLDELASLQDMEKAIAEALKELAQQTSAIPALSSPQGQHEKLEDIAGELEQLYESLIRNRGAQVREDMIELLNQLIQISQAEEDLLTDGQEFDIDQQDRIIEATRTAAESLYVQQKKSMYVTPRMGKNLVRALTNMNNAKNPGAAQSNVTEAMRLVNLVALEVLQNLEKAAQGGGSSTGFDQFLKELASISQGQMALNQSMSGFFPLPVAGLTPQQQAQLSRLAGKQRALREALESATSDYGASEHQALLDELVDEMKDIEEALYQHKIDRQLIERQKQVLTRLLDAQKSIHKEDYGKERKSKPGMDNLAKGDSLTMPTDLGRDELRALLQEALRETFPKDYEVYIREYFKRLIERQ